MERVFTKILEAGFEDWVKSGGIFYLVIEKIKEKWLKCVEQRGNYVKDKIMTSVTLDSFISNSRNLMNTLYLNMHNANCACEKHNQIALKQLFK